jgi:glycosyltransferase involved in cell wall biosynthesis
MGAFPIQTSTSCAGEWFIDGQGGTLVEPNNLEAVSAKLLEALRDDQLVESAMTLNLQQATKLFSESVLKEKAKNVYSSLLKAKD